MSVKGAGTGHFQIPAAPAALTAVAQNAAANTLGAAVAFGNAPSALYITGVTIGAATTQVPTYIEIQILVAAAIVTSVLVPYGVSSGVAASVLTGYRPIFPPIPVANGAAITVKSASSVASAVNWGVSLECIAQANVVDDGIAITTVTTLTNLPAITANWLTAAGIAAAALNGKGDWNIGKTGYALSAAGVQAIWDALTAAFVTVGSIGKLLLDNINATISSRAPSATALSTADYTAARAGKIDNLDAAVTTRAAAATALSTVDYTAARAGKLDNLDAAVTTRAAAATAVSNADYTAARAAKLDNLDVVLSTRLATAGYTVPPTVVQNRQEMDANSLALAAIFARTDVATSTRLATAGYTVPDNAGIGAAAAAAAASAIDAAAIRLKTDSLTFTVPGVLDINILRINGVVIVGDGSGTPFNV